MVAAVVRKMLKTRVTLGNTSRILLNLTERLIFVMFKDSSPLSQCSRSQQSYFLFRSSIMAASRLNYCSLPYLFRWCRDIYIQLRRVYLLVV